MKSRGFTLIELLVVIAIIAILSVVVILTLNPAALLQQSRDANRVSDMSVLNSAISIYLSAGGNSLGNTNTVYVSIPDPTATSTAGDQCQGLGLPSLPSTYSYHCAATSTVRNTDSTGWIPVNFGTVAIGSSLSQLPLDPTNQSSSRLYYTYTTNSTQFETTAAMESAKYKLGGSNDVVSGDGSTLSTVYAKGSNVNIEPLDYGDTSLVGYWPLTEVTGTVAYDYSGSNATGTWSGTANGTSGYYSVGKIGPWAGAFDGTDNLVTIPYTAVWQLNGPFTIALWMNESATQPSGQYPGPLSQGTAGDNTSGWNIVSAFPSNVLVAPFYKRNNVGYAGTTIPNAGQWFFWAVTYNGATITDYSNGLLDKATSITFGTNTGTNNLTIGNAYNLGGNDLKATIDDVRIYNRALSASEISAMYVGGK